ncbi:MAG: 23S rRNA (uracil(1939)-C(5))-methyltransferase RlmD [Bacteroidota bacterium]|nr:23S rRNA (uracil(1939)-C(5))-methyltransferase RlmD [Bacteroidota bacterium]MDP4212155.1 23S rRNA (uracil(1939)-C(5))-methyltransferase RlmD [Bacteroidota bacterium]MDP4249029.1 23S rRNA (uracil(1939)-C(5))-methyltransferase RlmD [Bacteroidota bacterium]
MGKKKNIVLENLLVTGYAAEGKSLAKHEGKVIFIERAIPGDTVTVMLTKNKKDWAEGHVLSFQEYAKERIKPFCSHFGVCGGCQWQMLPYEKQLEYKQDQVWQSLKRIGKMELPPIMPILGAAHTTAYRNKLEYTFSNRRYLLREELQDRQISAIQDAAGFHARGVFDKIVDVDICFLQEEPTNLIRKEVKRWGIENKVSFYDIVRHEGFLRNMQVRICRTGELMLNIVLGYFDGDLVNRLLTHLVEKFPAITTLLYTINAKVNDSLNGLDPVVFHGKGYVVEKLERFSFKIGPKSFFQTHTAQAERLYQTTRDFAGLSGKETVYDLYCGTGSIGIFLSDQAKRVIGVELIPEAIADAKENAALNEVSQADFFSGDVTELCNNAFFETHGRPDVIITDPPRAGMTGKLVSKLLEIAAEKIVYVSCNPATQARDLQLLSEKYAVGAIQPVDMFPHTHHIENVTGLFLKH